MGPDRIGSKLLYFVELPSRSESEKHFKTFHTTHSDNPFFDRNDIPDFELGFVRSCDASSWRFVHSFILAQCVALRGFPLLSARE